MNPTIIVYFLLFQPTQGCIDRIKTAGFAVPKPFVRLSTPGGDNATQEEIACYNVFVSRTFMDPFQMVPAKESSKPADKKTPSAPAKPTEPINKKELVRPKS